MAPFPLKALGEIPPRLLQLLVARCSLASGCFPLISASILIRPFPLLSLCLFPVSCKETGKRKENYRERKENSSQGQNLYDGWCPQALLEKTLQAAHHD